MDHTVWYHIGSHLSARRACILGMVCHDKLNMWNRFWKHTCTWDLNDCVDMVSCVKQLRHAMSICSGNHNIILPSDEFDDTIPWTFLEWVGSKGHLDILMRFSPCRPSVLARILRLSLIKTHLHILTWMDEQHRDILVAENVVFKAIIEPNDNISVLEWLATSSFEAKLFSPESIYKMGYRLSSLKWLYRKRPALFVPDVVDEAICWAGTFGDCGNNAVRWLKKIRM
jgi:hypothetical protein